MENILHIISSVSIKDVTFKVGDLILYFKPNMGDILGKDITNFPYRISGVRIHENGVQEIRLEIPRDLHKRWRYQVGFEWENRRWYTKEDLGVNDYYLLNVGVFEFVGPLPKQLTPVEKKIRELNGKYATHKYLSSGTQGALS